MTEAEQREAARRFINKWTNKGREDEDDRSYWIEMLQNVLGQSNVTDRLHFQKKVVVNGNTKRTGKGIQRQSPCFRKSEVDCALEFCRNVDF